MPAPRVPGSVGAVRGTLAAAVILLAAANASAESLEAQVNRAIDRGVASIRRFVGADGAGRMRYHQAYPEGDTALLLYTLVKSGVRADDPQVAAALAWLRGRPPKHTYSAALQVLALDAFQDRAMDEEIRSIGAWIASKLDTNDRRWGYPGNGTDLSNTQYAVLGLWAAERHGYRAHEGVWAALLTGAASLLQTDGGFAYRRDRRTTGGMTVAGLTVLELALPRSPDGQLPALFADQRAKAKAAREKGWAYLERRFSVEGNPAGAQALTEDWFHYYLYGVERLCAIAGRDRIGGRDWYTEGAKSLVASQRDDGSWGEPWDTCFALLFLRRATLTTIEKGVRRVEGEGVAPRRVLVRPRAEVPFIRRWLLLGPLDDPDDLLLSKSFFSEEKAAPRALSFSGPHRWEDVRSLRDVVDLGGDAPRDGTLTCAFAYLHVRQDTDAVLWLGHDNACRAWVDGALVHDRAFEEHYGRDAFGIPLLLTPGAHRLLVKVHNYGGPHNLVARIAAPDGAPLPDVSVSTSPDGADFESRALEDPSAFSLDDLLCLLPREGRHHLRFDDAADVAKIAFSGCYGPYPLWSAEPSKRASHLPNPGAVGALALHCVDGKVPGRAYLKVRLPETPRLRLRLSATTATSPGKADSLLRVSVFDGAMTRAAGEAQVGPDAQPDAANWKWAEFDLAGLDGREVLLILEAADGGTRRWHYEGIWIDELEID